MIEHDHLLDMHDCIDLHLEVAVDDEVIISRPGDSLVGNFIRMLHKQAGETNSARTGINDRSHVLGSYDTQFETGATLATSVVPNELHIPTSSNTFCIRDQNGESGLVQVWSKLPELNGFFCFENNGSSTDSNDCRYNFDVYQASIDPQTNVVTKGTAVDWSGIDTSAFDGRVFLRSYERAYAERSPWELDEWKIILGSNNNALPVSIETQWVDSDAEGPLDGTGTNRSAPAVSTFESVIELSRTYTNNQSDAVHVGHVGVAADNGDRGDDTLIALETVNFDVPASSTVTVTYRLKVSNASGGGIMAQFNELLYRKIDRVNREVKDIDNNNQLHEASNVDFIMAYAGADCREGDYNRNVPRGWEIGPVVGVGTTDVSNTDFALESQVPHGHSDGELFYYGSAVDDVYVDPTGGIAYFDVVRLFENRGSTSVSVTETGLYCGGGTDNSNYEPEYGVMISRHKLASAISVPAGEVLKLAYRIQASV